MNTRADRPINGHVIGALVDRVTAGDLKRQIGIGTEEFADLLTEILERLAIQILAGARAREQTPAVVGGQGNIPYAAQHGARRDGHLVRLIGDALGDRVGLDWERGLIPQIRAGGQIQNTLVVG